MPRGLCRYAHSNRLHNQYQRDDGKIHTRSPREANFVSWFKDFPYPYASADANSAFHHRHERYVVQSGDSHSPREVGQPMEGVRVSALDL